MDTLTKVNAVDRNDRAFRNAKASLEIENQTLQVGAEELILRKLNGQISQADFLREAAALALRE